MKTLGFIGGGNMARSIVGGLLATGYPSDRIWVSDPSQAQLKLLQELGKINAVTENAQIVSECDCILLAVKPQVMKEVVSPLVKTICEKKPLVISIAAGIRCAAISDWLSGHDRIVRVMPNTPSLVQKGAAGLFATETVTPEERAFTEEVMATIGISTWVEDEQLMDAVTAVSGSGPAYYFLVMEAMIEAGRSLGLSDDTARQLTIQTALGAAMLASESSDDPGQLRQQVTSKGGTTEQAIESLKRDGLEQLFKNAMMAAAERSKELGDQLAQ